MDWSPLRASMPLPSAAWLPYFKYLLPTLQPDHFKCHGNSPDVRGEAKHMTVYTHTCGVQGTIMHVWGDCMCGQAVEALTWGLREHRFESHQQTPWKGFLHGFATVSNLCVLISGSWDTLTRGVVCGVHSSQYNPRMVRVSLDLGIVWQVWMCGVYGHPTTVPGLSEYLWNLRILYHSVASLDISRSECPCSLWLTSSMCTDRRPSFMHY